MDLNPEAKMEGIKKSLVRLSYNQIHAVAIILISPAKKKKYINFNTILYIQVNVCSLI